MHEKKRREAGSKSSRPTVENLLSTSKPGGLGHDRQEEKEEVRGKMRYSYVREMKGLIEASIPRSLLGIVLHEKKEDS